MDTRISQRKLDEELTNEEIQSRLSLLSPFEPKIKKGYLTRYASMVISAGEGAILKLDFQEKLKGNIV